MMRILSYKHIIFLLVPLFLVGCINQIEPQVQGWLHIGKPIQESVSETRTSADEIDYLVSISKNGNMVMNPIRYSVIGNSIPLSADEYTLIAESCTKTEAEALPTLYGQPRYVGTESFTISPNQRTEVFVKCSMANAAFKVVKDASFYYTSFKVTATVGHRSLEFSDDESIAYYNVEENNEATLTYVVEAIDAEGRKGYGSGSLILKARNLSKLNLKANSVGYLDIEITYDDTFTPYVTEIIILDEI